MTLLTGFAIEVFLAAPGAKPLLFSLGGISDCPPFIAMTTGEMMQDFH